MNERMNEYNSFLARKSKSLTAYSYPTMSISGRPANFPKIYLRCRLLQAVALRVYIVNAVENLIDRNAKFQVHALFAKINYITRKIAKKYMYMGYQRVCRIFKSILN